MKNLLSIQNLKIKVDKKEIIKGVSLIIRSGEVHALMGPNGSGKSTLAFCLMGHPRYKISAGKIILNGKNINKLSPETRAISGLFLSFQYPTEVAGVSYLNFLHQAYSNLKKSKSRLNLKEFNKLVNKKLRLLKINQEFLSRSLNEGFSGGEKKKSEILQLAVLEPKFAILDETDSGLDIDALKIVTKGIKQIQKASKMGILVITHYPRILRYLKPDFVHILHSGKIVASGKEALAQKVEKKGYGWLKKKR